MADPTCLLRDLRPLGLGNDLALDLFPDAGHHRRRAGHVPLTHEVLHGHPFPNQMLSELLVFPGFTVYVPYLRFKDLHLQHHFDPALTDPYDDPESNYLEPAAWARLSRPVQLMLRFNNTLFGRIADRPGDFHLGTAEGRRQGDLRGGIASRWLGSCMPPVWCWSGGG